MRHLILLGSLTFALGADRRTPILLELFTSEGCSSCPPADHLLGVLDKQQPVAGVELIVLSEHVDYWDRLGWTDPYSSSAFSARQNEYASRFRLNGPYTPQLVIDGQFQVVGSDRRGALSLIERARKGDKCDVTLTGAKRDGNRVTVHVSVGELPEAVKKGVVYLALAELEAKSQVVRGENAGRELSHVAVVRTLSPVGHMEAGQVFSKEVSAALKPGAGIAGLRVVAFVEDAGTRRIVGVARIGL